MATLAINDHICLRLIFFTAKLMAHKKIQAKTNVQEWSNPFLQSLNNFWYYHQCRNLTILLPAHGVIFDPSCFRKQIPNFSLGPNFLGFTCQYRRVNVRFRHWSFLMNSNFNFLIFISIFRVCFFLPFFSILCRVYYLYLIFWFILVYCLTFVIYFIFYMVKYNLLTCNFILFHHWSWFVSKASFYIIQFKSNFLGFIMLYRFQMYFFLF